MSGIRLPVDMPIKDMAEHLPGKELSDCAVVASDGSITGKITDINAVRFCKNSGKMHAQCALTLELE